MANYRHQAGYQYETSPRKLQPEYEPKKSNYKKKTTALNKQKLKNAKKRDQRKQLRTKTKAVLSIGICFAILFTISYRNSLINESFNKKENLKKELSTLQKENEQLKVNIENSLNLNNVEQSAKESLGMQKLDNGQRIYINLPKKDYIESATEEVIIEESESWFRKILNQFGL